MTIRSIILSRRAAPPQWAAAPITELNRDWLFVPSSPNPLTRLLRLRAKLIRRTSPPPSQILKPLTAMDQWTCIFLYLPDGVVTPSHDYMLCRLRQRLGGLMVVYASPDPQIGSSSLYDRVDALIWKSLAGFDFSAYALAIDAVAQYSPGADLFIVNDSVLGPFGDLEKSLSAMPWDLSGFTASAWHENHIQSYAFQLRSIDPIRAASLAPAVSTTFAYDRYRDVILAQETAFARTAARSMSVGALWYGPRAMGDPSVHAALSLVESGFPFLKRKLFHRDAGLLPIYALTTFLESHGHPIP